MMDGAPVDWGVGLSYLASCVLALLALRRAGHRFGMAAVALAIATTLYIHNAEALPEILIAITIGGAIGILVQRRLAAAAIAQMIALFHGAVSLAAVMAGIAAFVDPAAFGIVDTATGDILGRSGFALGLAVLLGAVAFVGSVVAFLKPGGIVSIGRANMSLLLSVLNSVSGCAAAAMGLGLGHMAMIAIGALVGASGASLALVIHRTAAAPA
ncbi:MAG: NAD(P)(+) transhydrogenase (Re/Si-specific) subunit beta [Sphingobium sp.]